MGCSSHPLPQLLFCFPCECGYGRYFLRRRAAEPSSAMATAAAAMPMAGGVGCPSITTNVRMGSRGADGNLRCIRLPGGFVAVYDGRMDGTAGGIIVGDGDGGGAGNGEISKGTVALRGLNGSVVGGIVGDVESGIGNGDAVRPKRRAITGGDREGDAGDGKIAEDRDFRTARCCAQG